MKNVIDLKKLNLNYEVLSIIDDYLENNKETRTIVFVNFVLDSENFNLSEEQYLSIAQYFIDKNYKVIFDGLLNNYDYYSLDEAIDEFSNDENFYRFNDDSYRFNVNSNKTEIDEIETIHDHIKSYMKSIAHIKVLTREEEQDLGRLILDGDKEARNKLITSNLKLVVAIGKNYIRKNVPFMEIIEEGNAGLIKAVDRYDYRKGFKFGTYATWYIRQAIFVFLTQNMKAIKTPMHVYEKIKKLSKAKKELTQKLEREPSLYELEKYMNSPAYTLEKIIELEKTSRSIIELDSKIGEDEDTAIIDFIEYDYGDSPLQHMNKVDKQDYVAKLLDRLNDIERVVIMHRFQIGGYEFKTLDELSALLKVSRERIRQIEKIALRKLKFYGMEKRIRHDIK